MVDTERPRQLRQFYGGTGVPMRVEHDPGSPARAWRAHRERLRGWLDALPDEQWSGPTRCALWDVSALARHLASGAQFLGYTLHKAKGGTATSLLKGFDPHGTVQERAAMLGEMTPRQTRESLAAMDASVLAEMVAIEEVGWSVMAEAPPGQLPAGLSINHFLFDSWVHEYDLMVPRGERPVIESSEAEAVVTYVVALAAVAIGSTTPLELRLIEPELRIGLRVVDGETRVALDSSPPGAAVIEGRTLDIVDRATGRKGGPVRGDEPGLAVLDGFGRLLSG